MIYNSSQALADFLTCCDNKKQQADVELHFQSWDISVSENLLIPNPYRLFRFTIICALWGVAYATTKPRKTKNWSLVFLRRLQSQRKRRGVRSETFLLHHFLLTETAVLSGALSAAQSPKWDTRVSDGMSCNVGWTEGQQGERLLHRLQAVPFGRLNQLAFPKMRGRNPAVAAGAGFYTHA